MDTNNDRKDRDNARPVVNATRDAVVNAAERIDLLKKKTAELARKAGKKWEESKPRRQKATDDLKKAGHRVIGFGKDVGDGLKEGIAEAKKRNSAA